MLNQILSKKKLAVIVNANETIGLGHLYRSMAIAEDLRKKTVDAYFIVPSNLREISILQQKQFKFYQVSQFNAADYEKKIKSILSKNNTSVIFLDLLKDDLRRHSFLKYFEIKKISLMSFENCFVGFEDIVIFPGVPLVKPMFLRQEKYGNIKFYYGLKYLPISKEFFGKYSARKFSRQDNKVLVTMGGADPKNFTTKVIQAINKIKSHINCTVVLGKYFSFDADLLRVIKESKHSVKIVRNTDKMSELVSANDLAVISGGTTRYEMVAAGIPFISLSIHKTQYNITNNITKFGAGINLGVGSQLSLSIISKKIQKVLSDCHGRKKMHVKMKNILDSSGLDKVTNIIFKEM